MPQTPTEDAPGTRTGVNTYATATINIFIGSPAAARVRLRIRSPQRGAVRHPRAVSALGIIGGSKLAARFLRIVGRRTDKGRRTKRRVLSPSASSADGP